MVAADALNRRELARYARRVEDRWPLEAALLGGARVDDARGLGRQRERGPEWVVVLVSGGFAGVPWLERVHQAGSLWDAGEMGAPPTCTATPRPSSSAGPPRSRPSGACASTASTCSASPARSSAEGRSRAPGSRSRDERPMNVSYGMTA